MMVVWQENLLTASFFISVFLFIFELNHWAREVAARLFRFDGDGNWLFHVCSLA
ncbi:hypothetical protein N9955_00585 [bacterium]|nr:hypothetical protein [bacterium]